MIDLAALKFVAFDLVQILKFAALVAAPVAVIFAVMLFLLGRRRKAR